MPESGESGAPVSDRGSDAERWRRRHERERAARLEAEAVAERVTRDLYDALTELTESENRAHIVSEAAASLFAGAESMDAVLAAIADSARRALRAERATCYVHSEDQDRISAVYTTETDARRRAGIESAVGLGRERMPLWAYVLAQPGPLVVVEDVENGSSPPGLAGAVQSRAFLGVRLEHATLRSGGAPVLLGTLVAAFPEPRSFSERECLFARSLASLAVMAIANARLHVGMIESLAKAEREAAIDSLTRVANHRAFHERLAEEVTRAHRHRHPLSLVVVDLDHFKKVNDTRGHQTGDEVLRETARRLAGIARREDLVGRVGGEEFALLLPDTDGLSAWRVAERARATVAQTRYPEVGRVTLSAGVAELAASGDAQELYRLADDALYRAKAHGRNMVFLASARLEPHAMREQAERVARFQAMQSIRILARAADAKVPALGEHSERVGDLAARLAITLGWSVERAGQLREAGLLHDVGKIGVSREILLKPGRLSAAEYEKITGHADVGAEIVAEVLSSEQVSWVRHHHERFDGTGYPTGLRGAAIPDGARLLAVADAWDAMTRGVRPVALEAALAECLRHSGAQFCPQAVAALRVLFDAGSLTVDTGSPVTDAERPLGSEPVGPPATS